MELDILMLLLAPFVIPCTSEELCLDTNVNLVQGYNDKRIVDLDTALWTSNLSLAMCLEKCYHDSLCLSVNVAPDTNTCVGFKQKFEGRTSETETVQGYLVYETVKTLSANCSKADHCSAYFGHSHCNANQCQCDIGCSLDGFHCRRLKDCEDVFNFVTSTPGNYAVFPLNAVDPFYVRCDDPINYGIVMMHRDIHSPGCTDLPVTYLDVGWDQYKESFSEDNCYFWLGLEKIHALTSAKPYQLHIYVKDSSLLEATSSYSHFQVGNEASRYMMTAAGFSSSSSLIGDRFYLANPTKSHNGTHFCTDGNCVSNPGCGSFANGGWWYTDVCYSNPHHRNTIGWVISGGYTSYMKEMTMTLRPEVQVF